MTAPTANPAMIPPTLTTTKSRAAPAGEKVAPITAAATAVRYAIRAVASLIRLSPPGSSRSGAALRVARRRPSPTPHPAGPRSHRARTRQPAADPGSRHAATRPTTTMENSTRPTASRRIGRMFARRSRIGVKYAAENRIGGRNSRKTRSELRVIAGRSGTNPMAMPPARNRIGSATPMRRATYERTRATTRRAKTSSIAPMPWFIPASPATRPGPAARVAPGHPRA
jgi:hypothetical protein